MRELLVYTVVIQPGGTPRVPVTQSITNLTDLFSNIGINVIHRPYEPITARFLADLHIGSCSYGEITEEQRILFKLRDGIVDRAIAIYFVHTTDQSAFGCAVHPPNVPGAVVAQDATPWTLAHEIGHVMELPHRNADNALMNTTTKNIRGTPELSDNEITALLKSPWLREEAP